MSPPEPTTPPLGRRGFLGWAAAAGALTASYGTALAYALRFLYPGHRRSRRREVFVTMRSDVGALGYRYTMPAGQEVVLRLTSAGILALSNVCPHLGCKVRWEAPRNRFFCPCHEGTFAPDGTATGGPPKTEGKDLSRYEVVARGEALYLRYQES